MFAREFTQDSWMLMMIYCVLNLTNLINWWHLEPKIFPLNDFLRSYFTSNESETIEANEKSFDGRRKKLLFFVYLANCSAK